MGVVRRRVIPGVSSVVVVGLVVAAAFFTTGFKPIESETSTTNVWVSRSGSVSAEGSQFGRVNVAAGELDSFLKQGNATGMTLWTVGSSTVGVSGSKLFRLNDSQPQIDIEGGKVAEADQLSTGTSITQIVTGGGNALFLDHSNGRAFTSSGVSFDGITSSFAEISTSGTVLAGAVSTTGVIYLVERTDTGTYIETYVRENGKLTTIATLSESLSNTAQVSVSVVGNAWVALSTTDSTARVYTNSSLGGVDITAALGQHIASAVLARSSASGSRALVGIPGGLVGVPLADPGAAAPVVVDGIAATVAVSPLATDANGCVVGAWADGSANSGAIATICGDNAPTVVPLTAPAGAKAGGGANPVLKIRGSGSSLLVNDAVSGHSWKTDGTPIASAWTWSDPDDAANLQQANTTELTQAQDPMAPVANDDTFSIRPGRTSIVPVLLNDTDPNGDPFYIAQSGERAPRISTSSPSGITVSTVNNNQELAVTVPATAASGTITVTYSDTDGTSQTGDGGLYSKVAAATLTIVDASANTPPKRVQTDVTSISVAPGGSAVVDVLQWWADAELDPLVISDVSFVNPSQGSEASVVVQPDGTLLFRQFGTTGSGPYPVVYSVSDGHGGVATDTLIFQISQQMTAANFAIGAVVGTPVTVDLSTWVHGASNAAKVNISGVDGVSFTDGLFGFVFTATAPGDYVVPYTVVDSGAVSGRVLVHAVAAEAAQLSVAPMTIKLRADEYQTLNVMDAISGAGSDVALVTGVTSATKKVDATVLDFGRVRAITNDTVGADDADKIIDTLTYTVQAGSRTATGQLSVHLLPKLANTGAPVVVNDSVTVVSGAQVNIPVLDNDRDPNGGALSLNAAWTSQDPDGAGGAPAPARSGVYFPSSNVMRYLAPTVTDVTTISFGYDAIGSNSVHAQGTVSVTVVPASKASATVAPTLTARVVSKGSVAIDAPDAVGSVLQPVYFVATSGLDGVSKGVATISNDRRTLTYIAPLVTSNTTIEFGYTIQVGAGDSVQGTIRIGVSAVASNLAPVAVTDFVSVKTGEDARVSPVVNDIATDPANSLSLGTVTLASGATAVAYEVGSTDDPYSRKSDQRAPTVTATLANGSQSTIVIHPIDETNVPTVTLAYRVVESDGLESMGRIIVSFVNGDVNLFPVISDTTVTSQSYPNAGTQFSVDVVSGKVSWSTGDPGTLRVANLGNAPGISIDGHTVTGGRTNSTVHIPLSFTGTTNDGTSVTSFAFLTILGSNDEVPSVKAAAAVSINAGDSHTFDIKQDVIAPAGSTMTIDSVDNALVSGKATKDSDSTITYTANKDGGGNDSVRFVVDYTINGITRQATLAFSVFVVSQSPDVTVSRGTTGEVAPGESLSLSFLSLVNPWTGNVDDKAKLTYSITPTDPSSAQSQFQSTPTGGAITSAWLIAASETAKVGTTVHFTLVVSSADKQSTPVSVDITIVETHRNLPVAASCSASIDLSGSSAISKTYGVANGASGGATCAGGFNPFTEDLTVTDVSASSSAGGLSFVASGGAIIVTVGNPASSDIPSTVAVQFLVKDAQGRSSSNSTKGTLTMTFNARPLAPSIALTAYSTTDATFTVTPNALGGVADDYVLETSKNGTWSEVATQKASNRTFVYSGFVGSGASATQDFRVYARNNVDSSTKSMVITGVYPQALQAAPDSVTWVPATSGDGLGTVKLTVTGGASTAEKWIISVAGGATDNPINSGVVAETYTVSSTSTTRVTVTGQTVPCVPCRSASGPSTLAAGATTVDVISYGAPALSGVAATVTEDGSAAVSFTATLTGPQPGVAYAGLSSDFHIPAWGYCAAMVSSQSGASCNTASGNVPSNGSLTTAPTITTTLVGTMYGYVAISNGTLSAEGYSPQTQRFPSASTVRGAFSVSIGESTSPASNGRWFVPTITALGAPPQYTYQYGWGGPSGHANTAPSGSDWATQDFSSTVNSSFGNSAAYAVRACTDSGFGTCGEWVTLNGPSDNAAPVAFSDKVTGLAVNDPSTCVAAATNVAYSGVIVAVTANGTVTLTGSGGLASIAAGSAAPYSVTATTGLTFATTAAQSGVSRNYVISAGGVNAAASSWTCAP